MKFGRSDVCFSSGLEMVDENAGVIKGVMIAREGIAKGHGVFLDSAFISKVAELGNEQEQGVKARFGHPNMCAEALGTYIGRFKNFRVKEDKVYADLHMDEVAKKAPQGDLYSYVFAMARNNGDMFGNSIVFKSGESRFEEELDENENVVTKEYVSIVALTASDLVDEPAATDSLFSADTLSAKATEFFDANPEVFELLANKPEIVEQFLNRYNNYKTKQDKMEKSFSEKVLEGIESLKTLFSAKEEVEAVEAQEVTEEVVAEEVTEEVVAEAEEPTAEEVAEAEEQVADIVAETEQELEAEFSAKEDELRTEFSNLIAEKDEEIRSLKADLEAKELELSSLSVSGTQIEGSEDPSISGEEKQLSESAKAIQDFLRKNK